MPNLSIKDVPQDLAEALRRRALSNHRSLQGELMAIIEQAAQEAPPALALAIAQRAGGQANAPRAGKKSIEQIAAEHLARHPHPITGPLAVDLIREDRDAR